MSRHNTNLTREHELPLYKVGNLICLRLPKKKKKVYKKLMNVLRAFVNKSF